MEKYTARYERKMTIAEKLKEAEYEYLMKEYIYECAIAWKNKAEKLYDSIKSEMAKVDEKVKEITRRYDRIRKKIEIEIEVLKRKCESYEALIKSYNAAIRNEDFDMIYVDLDEDGNDELIMAEGIYAFILQSKNDTEKEIEALYEKSREADENQKQECEEVKSLFPHMEIQQKADYCMKQYEKIERWIREDDYYYYDESDKDESSDYCDAYYEEE